MAPQSHMHEHFPRGRHGGKDARRAARRLKHAQRAFFAGTYS
jgi:hypothetical protein